MRHAFGFFLLFVMAGDWVTTPEGVPVCRLTTTIVPGMTLRFGFCEDWQPGFSPAQPAQQFPFNQGWIRPAWPGVQIHVENKGWVP
jgi:hypothetical protein